MDIALFLSLPFFGFTQKEFNNWYFGDSAGVSFNIGVPVVFMTNKMPSVFDGSSNISDSLGNILFYSNGGEVYNRNVYRLIAAPPTKTILEHSSFNPFATVPIILMFMTLFSIQDPFFSSADAMSS